MDLKSAGYTQLFEENKRKLVKKKPSSVLIDIGKNALKVLEKRYLKKDENGKVMETPEELLRRVADNISQAEIAYGTKANMEDMSVRSMR